MLHFLLHLVIVCIVWWCNGDVRVGLNVQVFVFARICVGMCVRVHVDACAHTCVYTCVRTYVRVCECVC